MPSLCLLGFAPGIPASSHNPKNMHEVGLIRDPKLTLDVTYYLSLCINPTTDSQPVQPRPMTAVIGFSLPL